MGNTINIRGITINLHRSESLSNHLRREREFFEPDILDYLRDIHGQQKVIVDVGANFGNHAVYFANFLKYQKLICFEPIPDNFDLLKRNLTYPHTKLLPFALSDKKTTLKMTPNRRNMGASKVDENGSLSVCAITLDSLDLEDVTLLKIDVEGYEPNVLAGAKKTIKKCHPLILIEDKDLIYQKLLPGYVLEKGWPQHKTYLYRWSDDETRAKPYLISICSYSPSIEAHNKSLTKLEDSVERINVDLEKYPGHLFRWDYIPKDLDRKRVFLFTDTFDVYFQKPIPPLSPDKIYVANEGEIFVNNSWWRHMFRHNPQFNSLKNETIYNVGTFACSGKIMDSWVKYIQEARRAMDGSSTEQLLFNVWLRLPENIARITELPDLFCSIYANLEKGIAVLNEKTEFINQQGDLFSVVHFNGSTKKIFNKLQKGIVPLRPFAKKLSIIIAFYNSHGAVARQVKHFHDMDLPDDIEFIFVDDGSNPPHRIEDYHLKNLTLHHTNDKRPWTQGLARNAGAKLAQGEYLFMTDIDHILSREAIMDAYNFTGDKMTFRRYFGVLLEDGTLTQDPDVLEEYGLDIGRLRTKRGLYASVHGNTFVMKKATFELLGCYDERLCLYGHHAPNRGGEDGDINHKWNHWAAKLGVLPVEGSNIYMFPIGRYHITGNSNPFGLFHDLSQAQIQQPNKP